MSGGLEIAYGYGLGQEVKPVDIFYFPNSGSSYFYTSYGYKMDTVSSIDIEDGKLRTFTFTDDALGDILARDEKQHTGGGTTNPHEVHYYLNGIQIGDNVTIAQLTAGDFILN